MTFVPKVYWKKTRVLRENEKTELAKKLADGYYIILTGDAGHLSSWLVSLGTLFTLGKWSKYSHSLMNCDYMDKPEDRDKFKFVEATVAGVHYSTFDEVFNCDFVCLLSPRGIKNEDWTAIIDALVKETGKEYDDLFDLIDSTKMSCVESVLNALKSHPRFANDFFDLEYMIKKKKRLLPQMFKDCRDFDAVWESKRAYRYVRISFMKGDEI